MGYFGQALKTSANYLPSQVTDMLNQGRDFAFARMPTCGLANVCAIAKLVLSIYCCVIVSYRSLFMYKYVPSVLRYCWLGTRKTIRPVKNLRVEVLVWLSVWSKVQIDCIWST